MRKRIRKVMQRLDLFTSHEQTCVIKQMHAYLQLEIILNIQQSPNNNEKHFSTEEQTHYFNFSQHMTFRGKVRQFECSGDQATATRGSQPARHRYR